MTKYVALLRGITPSNPKMRSEKFRQVFQRMGFSNVSTVISSGNVLFESQSTNTRALEELIEKMLTEKLGFTSTAIVYSQKELQHLVDNKPFGTRTDTPNSRLNVTFLKNKPKVGTLDHGTVGIHGRAVCSVVDFSVTRTPDIMLQMERRFGKGITTRTWKSVNRILKKLEDGVNTA